MKEFTEKYTESGKVGGVLVDNYFKSVQRLISYIPQNELENTQVLEVGCGPGFSTQRLLNLLPRSVKLSASDVEEENVQDTLKKVGERAKVSVEDVYNLEREDSSLDLIFVLEVMEHLEQPEDALKELKRVCKKYMILGVPNEPIWRILNMARMKYLKDLGNTPGHVQHWNMSSFKKLLESNGFKVLKTQSPLPWSLVLVEKKV